MKLSKVTIGLMFTILLSMLSCKQTEIPVDPKEKEIDNICDKVMESFTKEDFSVAYQLLKANSAISPESIDTLKSTTTRYAATLFPAYGKIRSYDFVSQHKIKDVISKRFYLLKFDRYYLKFDFTLYNNGDKWTITSFTFNEDLIELLY